MTTDEDYAAALMGTEEDHFITLVEITDDRLSSPIRVVKDNEPFVMDGKTFQPLQFEAYTPNDTKGQESTARISIDNVGRELTEYLELSDGGEGALVRIMHVLRADNGGVDVPVYENVQTRLSSVKVNPLQVTGEIGYRLLLGDAATKITFRPETAPGLS